MKLFRGGHRIPEKASGPRVDPEGGGGGGGGGPRGEHPNFIKRGKKLARMHVREKKRRVLVLNSYPETPISEILSLPLEGVWVWGLGGPVYLTVHV